MAGDEWPARGEYSWQARGSGVVDSGSRNVASNKRNVRMACVLVVEMVLAACFLAGVVACDAWLSPASSVSEAADEVCDDCPACGPAGECPGEFCSPSLCIRGRCVAQRPPCDDGDPHTWDRCDASRQSCSHSLADGLRACSSASECTTDQPCQRFQCDGGLCRLTEESRFCGDAFLRPVGCKSLDDCVRHQLWALSPQEKAMTALAQGPWCVAQADGGSYCSWFQGPGSTGMP